MWGRFKLRLLFVIVLLAVIGLVMQTGHESKEIVEPVLKYIMNTDYDVAGVLSPYINNSADELSRALPAQSLKLIKTPCDFEKIERNYGWYWSGVEGRQQFCPGIYLKVKENTPVKPILEGEIQEVRKENTTLRVVVRHSANIVSVYGGLKEVLVDQNSKVESENIIGRTGNTFYFEVRNQDGPVNPAGIFK